MADVTLRIIDGADRGRAFDDISTPVTIGREEGNTIQLNDERVRRFHLKIQEDREKVVLTDLESTNGTKVNGEDVQLRILRFGDVINVGRSVILYGSREQIAKRLASLRGDVDDKTHTVDQDDVLASPRAQSLDYELNWSAELDDQATLHALMPPDLPEGLSPGQAAQLSELLEYLHLRIRDLLASVKLKGPTDRVNLEARQWQNLLDIQARLATYLRDIGDPQG